MPQAQRPNILLLFTDQQRFDTIAAAGYPHMRTPAMDRLVREGCLYANAYTPNPICMAARHSLLLGMPSSCHGYVGNHHQPIRDFNAPTLPRLLSRAGYVTGAVGKMHFVPPREHHGFDEMHLMEELPRYREEDAYLRALAERGYGDVRHIHGVRHLLYHTPQRSRQPEEHHGSTWVADRSIRFLDENRTRPFFLWAGWVGPHPPFNIPGTFQDLYRDVPIPDPIPRSRSYPFNPEPSAWYGDCDTPEEVRVLRRAYYSAISLIDKNVGRILDHLEETGLAENTLVLFTSDHGEMLADKGFYQKALPYDPACRIPFVVRWPGRVPAGSRRAEFVDLLDILPTCLDAAGVPYPAQDALAGESLFTAAPRRDRATQWSEHGGGAHRWIMQRDARYKYVYWYNRGTEELYDLERDPQETRNLLPAGAYPAEVLDALRARCFENELRWGTPARVEDGRPAACEANQFHDNMAGKFPLWAHQQFPTWGPGTPEQEAALMEGEILSAAGLDPEAGDFRRLHDCAEWRRAWKDGWNRAGGSDAFYERLFGE